MEKEMIIVLDFGGQYNQLIARRVRECNVYAEVHPYTLSLEKIKEMNPKGIIFTGGPNSVYGEDSPRCPKEIFEMGIPILGICYGSQLMAYMLGGKVETAPGNQQIGDFRFQYGFKKIKEQFRRIVHGRTIFFKQAFFRFFKNGKMSLYPGHYNLRKNDNSYILNCTQIY